MKGLKHITLAMVVVSLLTGPILFGFAPKAHAGVAECIAGITAGKAKAKAAGATGGIQAVPTNSRAVNNITGDIAGQTTGSTITRCIVEPIVIIMARALLDNFTAQTINWINSGFQGSPLYVTNLQGFLADAADQVAGQFIEGLGPIGSILCSPFDFQLRISLGLQYGRGGGQYKYIGCRLSDIEKNIQKAFTSGSFGKNGWDNWIKITATPQNNPYGAYLRAVETIDARIAGTQFSLKTQLDFGKGFLSSVDPKTGKITTPGSLIEDQLSDTLGQQVRNVGLAKDIDAILNALVGQLINQVMGGIGGLAGASDSRSSSVNYQQSGVTYQSAVDRANRQTVASMIEANRQAQNLPAGLIMNTGDGALNPTGGANSPTPATFCAQFKNNIYGTDANSAVRVKVNGTTNPGASAVLTSKTTATGEPVPWTIADYNNAATFCQNIGKTTALKIGVDDFNEQSGINGTNTEAPIAERVNLALRQTATQSNTLNGFIASQGNDGNQRPDKTERSTFGTAVACKPSSGGHAYWEVEWDLRPDNDNYIDKIIIYPALFIDEYNKDRLSDISTDGWKLLTDTEVKLFNNGALVSRSPITPNGTNPITINLCGSGICPQANKVRIEQTDKSPDKPGYTCLALAEVEAIRANMDASPAGENGGNDAGSATVATFEPAVSEVTIGSTVVNNFSNAFSLETNKTQNNLSVRLKLFKTTVGQQDGLVSFSTVFAPGSLKINDITFNESQMTEHTLIYANNVTLTANSPLQISQTGTVSSYTAGNTSYKLITDVLNSTGAVIATQTTSFKIQ